MKRFWPVLLAVFCWIILLSSPVTRDGVRQAWINHNDAFSDVGKKVSAPPFIDVFPQEAATLQRFPQDKQILLFVGLEGGGQNKSNLAALERLYPREPLVICALLHDEFRDLHSGRIPGPLTNPNYPQAPPKLDPSSVSPLTNWDKAIALARRGQELEPNNSYWDWMMIYALLATNQDEGACQVLKLAAHKTAWDNHTREKIQNGIHYLKLTAGRPVPPLNLIAISASESFDTGSRERQICRWTLESAMADRASGKHDEAIEKAFNLTLLSRCLREHGYSLLNSLVGGACEELALGRVTASVPLNTTTAKGASIERFHNNSGGLYAYAKAQSKASLLPKLDAEWRDFSNWNSNRRQLRVEDWEFYSPDKSLVITAAEHARAILIRALPAILILCVVFGIPSLRFQDKTEVDRTIWWGVRWGALLFLLVVGFDILTVFSDALEQRVWNDWKMTYLLSAAMGPNTSWLASGLPCSILCLAVYRAVRWQQSQTPSSGHATLGFKGLFQQPEDGISRFDFGWIFSLVARLTFWIGFPMALVVFCLKHNENFWTYAWAIPLTVTIFSLVAHLLAWGKGERRRQTLYLSFRIVFHSMLGLFASVSVLYALVSLSILPRAFQFERDFDSNVQKGELQIGREKLGLTPTTAPTGTQQKE